jgi:hypothetical protein
VNTFDPIDPALVDVFPTEHDGYPADLAAEDTLDVLKDACGSASRDFPQALWIEPKDWKDKAAENDKNKTWPINYVDRFTDQSPTHECTTHSLRACAEGARNRQRGIIYPDGPKKGARYEESKLGSVWLSPLSIYAEANPRQWGGANCRQVMEIACKRGFLPEKIQPNAYGFKHDLQGTTGAGCNNQSSGPWVSLSNFPSGWQETAKHFKPLEVILTDNWEQVVCLVLHGLLVGVGRSGHAIPYAFWNAAEEKMGYVDSYQVVRYDSKGTVRGASGGAFAIATMSVPDDWSKPAGE